MNLASGSGRDIKELLDGIGAYADKIKMIHCVDSETRAIDFSKKLLEEKKNTVFSQGNVLRIAAARKINSMFPEKYDFIYSTGLFDYLSYKVAARLIGNLQGLLKKNGVLAVANVRDKYSNPSVYFMEWVGEWNLIYRNEEEFKQLFIGAGFSAKNIAVQYEQQGVLQYILARKG